MLELYGEKCAPYSKAIQDLRYHDQSYLARIEFLCKRFQPFAPKSFWKSFDPGTNKFEGLLWEMILSLKLIGHGFELIPDSSKDGDRPDICIDICGRRVWIECYVPTLGNPNSKNYPISPKGNYGVRGVNINGLLLRLAGGLNEKKKQLSAWLEKGIVKENEPYIIAINGHILQFLDIDEKSLPRIMGVLYEVGPLCLEFDRSSEETRAFFLNQAMLKKYNNAEVNAGFFLDEQNCKASGMIYSTDWIASYSSRPKPKYCYVENVNAKNRVDINFDDFMQTYKYTESTISMKP